MRDVIQKIIATESEAKLIVEAAKAQADIILSDAQKKGHDIVELARQEAANEAGKIVDAAVEAANQEKQSSLKNAAVEIESRIRLDPATRQRAIEGIIRCVCKQK
jgi:vacuolar-type H+-ATPase subunit H